MDAMRFQFLEGLVTLYGEKGCVSRAFHILDTIKMELSKIGMDIELPKKIILNEKEYTREFLDDD